MQFQTLANSNIYFEISKHVVFEDRRDLIKTFLKVAANFPLALFYKLWITFLKAAAVFVSGLFLGVTLGSCKALRELFIQRVSSFAANLADWVLFPFAIAMCFFKFFLAMIIHPSLFFHY